MEELVEAAIKKHCPNNDGILAKSLVRKLSGVSIKELNRCLYNHPERFKKTDGQSFPPAWMLRYTNKSSNSNSSSKSAVFDQLILIDLGNVHDCFCLFSENISNTLVAAFADLAYNIEKLLSQTPCSKCSTDVYTKYSMGCKELYKSRLSHSNSADLLLIDAFYILLSKGRIGSETTVIIASKDKLLSTFAELIKCYVGEVYVVSDAIEMREVI